MTESFDPYYEWLGIRPEEHPITLYRLLGLVNFEDNPTVIERSADRQMSHLHNFQAGRYSALSQRLLNEVATARICLIDPEHKTEYDQQLAIQLRQHAEARIPVATPLSVIVVQQAATVAPAKLAPPEPPAMPQ